MTDKSFNARFRNGEVTAHQVVYQADRLTHELDKAQAIIAAAKEYGQTAAEHCVPIHTVDMLAILDGEAA